MRDFLKHTLATVLGLFIFLGISVGGLLLLLISISMMAARDSAPTVRDKSVLVFDLSQTITDAPASASTRDVLNDAIAGNRPNVIGLRSVLDAINEAAKDDRIVGLYLNGGNNPNTTGYATLREVRSALERFKQSGKRIYAYDVDWQEREYYLGSTADTIAMNPIGGLEMNGLSSEGVFFAQALQRFGVGVQVTRVGKYKSAVEPFLQNRRSPADRQQTQKLLSDIWTEILGTTSKARKLTPRQLQAITNRAGLLDPQEAVKQKLVDRVAYFDEVIADLKKITGQDDDTKSFRQISVRNYARVAESNRNDRSSRNQIAVVYAEGEIVNGQGATGQIGGDRLARQLRELRLDDDVKAVVLRVNSPGGSATASEIIQREAILTNQVKPVIVSMGNVAASGGYWISTYASEIFAEPTTITGSIGVFGRILNVQQLANRNGITWDVVKTGRFADAQTVSRPKTPQELALIQKSVDRIYDQFLTKVSASRKLQKSKVAEIAQGRVWSGIQAKQLGLVDQLGGLQDAIRAAAERANLGEDWQIEEFPKPRSFEERLLESLMGSSIEESTAIDPLTSEMKKFQAELESLKSMNDPQNVYLRLPVDLFIK
ncbi:MAG: signal peptide peptidase SppA [Leptolyngbya sp. UWPOB_LEPTO1]|uniref:signal peptide peptidase SppA n=1 Tax=Leptolyngbya sp. UWPOB_LEPTO1 TaxID=2815653 RepID=UPI001AD37143|nr:signal peptide peptidase SppA [Leptolyngbya sp. UWPOB_LEPTO1]MBN8561762.1 signal peptide peptidase SppA [Leptolyngbya sp. UWPOB_LEPTO1]